MRSAQSPIKIKNDSFGKTYTLDFTENKSSMNSQNIKRCETMNEEPSNEEYSDSRFTTTLLE